MKKIANLKLAIVLCLLLIVILWEYNSNSISQTVFPDVEKRTTVFQPATTTVYPNISTPNAQTTVAIQNTSNLLFNLIDSENHVHESQDTIPKIIHQFWDAPSVPKAFENNIMSWRRKHPTYEYWFWHASDVKRLLQGCYPKYFDLYKKYPATVNRADAMRYFVLYAFGGLYLDLDMIALKDNEDLLRNRSCVLTEETYEHSVIMYEHTTHPNLINAYMACKPAHPLFKKAIVELPKSRNERNHLRRTGPFYLDFIFQQYNKTSQDKSVVVLHPSYVMPTYDRSQLSNIRRKCMTSRHKAAIFKEACKYFNNRKSTNRPTPKSYANHLWTHTYMAERRWKSQLQIKIEKVIPGAVNITDRIVKMCHQK